MSEHTPLRIVNFADNSDTSPDSSVGTGRDARALSSLDKVTLALVIAALLLAALGAGTFSTLNLGSSPPQDALGRLQSLSVPLINLISAVALLTAVWRCWQRPVAIGPVNGLAGSALLLGVWGSLSLLVRQPISYLGLNAWAMLLASLTIGGLISWLGRDRKALILLLLTVAGAGSLAASFGVREYLEHWKMSDSTHRVFGMFGGPNFLAGYVLLTIPLTLSLFVSARERLPRVLLGLGLSLQSMCLLMTGSRSAAGMLGIVLLVWMFLLARASLHRGRVKLIGVGVGLVILSALLASAPLLIRVKGSQPAAPAPQTKNAGGASGTQTDTPNAVTAGVTKEAPSTDTQAHSAKFRQYTWSGTLKMAYSNGVTGVGIGNYETAYPRYAITAFTAHAHNSFLQFIAETGIPGLLFLMAVLAASTAFGTYVLFLNVIHQRAANARQTAGKSKSPSSRAKKSSINNLNENVIQSSDTELDADSGGSKDEDYGLPPLAFTPAPSQPLPFNFDEPRLLLAGLLAAVLSTVLHSLFDSDWYIVATALTLSAVLGLIAAVARDLAPLATQRPRPLSRGMLAGCGIVGLLLLWRGGTTYLARISETQALESTLDFQYQATHQDSHASESLQNAIDSYHKAGSLDPFNPEPHLIVSNLYQSQGKPDQALLALESATRIAPTGKTYYQLGQYHKRYALKLKKSDEIPQENPQGNDVPIALSGTIWPSVISAPGASTAKEGNSKEGNAKEPKPDLPSGTKNELKSEVKSEVKSELDKALSAFTEARDRDPHSLQTLRALAETYALLGNTTEAVQTYRDMTVLETTPLGTVRAIPEIIETEFAYAHARLAAQMSAQKKQAEALSEYQKADALLKIYWEHRTYELYQLLNEDKRRSLSHLYVEVLEGWTAILEAQGGTALTSLQQLKAEQAAFLKDLQMDEAAVVKARSEQNAAPDSPK